MRLQFIEETGGGAAHGASWRGHWEYTSLKGDFSRKGNLPYGHLGTGILNLSRHRHEVRGSLLAPTRCAAACLQTLIPIMENQMEKRMENEMET